MAECDDLAGFLLARVGEEEAAAQAAMSIPGRWSVRPDRREDLVLVLDGAGAVVLRAVPGPQVAEHVARWDPTGVLARCDAVRGLVEHYRVCARNWRGMPGNGALHHDKGLVAGLEWALRYLASSYASHPDFRPEWQPGSLAPSTH